MAQEIENDLKKQLLSKEFRPAITTWNRLESRTRKEDFDRSLQSEVRDPLWMLCRQWQSGEFKGEDAGSAVLAKVQMNTTRINRYAIRTEDPEAAGGQIWKPAAPYSDTVPLETKVEREALLSAKQDGHTANLELRIQAGRHCTKLLRQDGFVSAIPVFISRYPFIAPQVLSDQDTGEALEKAHIQTDHSAWQSLEALQGRLPDGIKILQDIIQGGFEIWINTQPEFSDPEIKSRIVQLGEQLKAWFFRLYDQPAHASWEAWAPPYLEYQFAISVPNDAEDRNRTTLVAEQYHHGRLDWYSFDVLPNERLPDDPEALYNSSRFREAEPMAFFPTQIEFNGMPAVRWWAFEDRKTDFGQLRAGTTDLAQLMLAELGLIYGTDWHVVPYNVEIGSLCAIGGIIVTDVFGVRTLIGPAVGYSNPNQFWNLYKLSVSGSDGLVDHRMFLPPAIGKIQESKPIEKVLLARDEMANMVWGVEDIIPGISGTGINGFESAVALSNYFLQRKPKAETEEIPNEAKIRFVLGTSVPENWIPFIARHKPGSNREIRLQRASMPRLTDAIPDSRVEPRGQILRFGLDREEKQPYFIHEEEVPRAGCIVTRSFQRTRWVDGKIYTWIGKRKQTGKGEGTSGLQFDQIIPRS